jgi:RNA polymerase sigma-70 factor (ECF subfamily)
MPRLLEAEAGASLLFRDVARVSLSEYDRMLLDRCLQGAPRAWEDFVDRFLGLVMHVVVHTAGSRGLRPDPALRDDLAAEVFLKLIEDDFAVLRRFRRQCSLATYLAVIARRVILRTLAKQHRDGHPVPLSLAERETAGGVDAAAEARIDDREHLEKMLLRLDSRDAEIVRMYHLEGKSYREISSTMGLSENSIGPALSRAREAMRSEETR